MAKKRPQDLLEELGISADEFAHVYRKLEEAGYIEGYFSGLSYQWEDLVADAEDAARDLGIEVNHRRISGRKPQQLRESFEIPLSDYARERAAALSEALADEAASYAAIRRFRGEVLGGEPLSDTQAHNFIASPAVRYFWFEWFKEWGIPVVEHAARVVATGFKVPAFNWGTLAGMASGFNPYLHSYYAVEVEPPGVKKSVLYAHEADVERPEGLDVDKQYYYSMDPEDEFDRPSTEKKIRYFAEDGIRQARMLPGSLLDRLRQLSDLLSGRYGWDQEESVRFVLTGKVPQVQPLEVNMNLLTGDADSPPVWTVSLEAAPWMPAKEVANAYQQVQQQILRGDSGKEHLGPKKLALFRFVREQTAKGEDEPDWQGLLDRWNEHYAEDPPWHYGPYKDPRYQKGNFKRDFEDAERKLLHPRHHFPRRKVSTVPEQWQEREVQDRRTAAKAANSLIEAYLGRATEGIVD